MHFNTNLTMSPHHKPLMYPQGFSIHDLPCKTLDTGLNGVHVSANPFGKILQINAQHTTCGIMVAIPYEPFETKYFGVPEEVRKYRKKMLDLPGNMNQGFGLELQDCSPVGTVILEHVGTTTDVDGKASFGIKGVRSQYTTDNNIKITATVAVTDDGEVRQNLLATVADNTKSATVAFRLRLHAMVSRASYAQLTEGGLFPMPGTTMAYNGEDEKAFELINVDMAPHGVLRGCLDMNGTAVALRNSWPRQAKDGVLGLQMAQGRITLTHGESLNLTARFRLLDRSRSAVAQGFSSLDGHWTRSLVRLGETKGQQEFDRSRSYQQYILWRNVDYILDSCCLQVDDVDGEPSVCVITDHVALPLGWNRDNYWQVKLLMKLRPLLELPDGSRPTILDPFYRFKNAYARNIDNVLLGHINWVFNTSERLNRTEGEEMIVYKAKQTGGKQEQTKKRAEKTKVGFWSRSYLIDGRVKDSNGIFQLDQQCFPLLELCDFYATYEKLPNRDPGLWERVQSLVGSVLMGTAVEEVLEFLVGDIDEDLGLVKTDETPADDPTQFGFLLSNNLLLWHTLKALGGLLARFPTAGEKFKALPLHQPCSKRQGLAQLVDRLHARIVENFQPLPGTDTCKRVFAYECGYDEDKNLRHRFYADGNDIPTLMAKEWGFLQNREELELWQNTMEWMFDPRANRAEKVRENKKTYWVGRYSGLGSDHSPEPWPLGMYQEWVYYSMRAKEKHPGAEARAKKAWETIEAVMQWDGTFSETVDMDTGRCTSKAWFSWPGAMIASAVLDQYTEDHTYKLSGRRRAQHG